MTDAPGPPQNRQNPLILLRHLLFFTKSLLLIGASTFWLHQCIHNCKSSPATITTCITGFIAHCRSTFLVYLASIIECRLMERRRRGTTLQAKKVVVSIYLTLPGALCPWGRLSLWQKWVPGIFLGIKGGRPARKADNLTTVCGPIV
jgi:hypothetical protein